jgi:hypothetical protein
MDFVEKIKIENIFTPEEANTPVTYGELAVIFQTIAAEIAKQTTNYADTLQEDTLKIIDKVTNVLVKMRDDAEYKRQRDACFMMGLIAQLCHCDKEIIHKEYQHWCGEFDKMNRPQDEKEKNNE